VPGTGIVPERWETGPSAGDDDGWERTTSDEAEVWAGGQDGVDSGDGLGRRGMLTQSQSMALEGTLARPLKKDASQRRVGLWENVRLVARWLPRAGHPRG